MAVTRQALVEYMVGNLGLQEDALSDDTLLFSTGLLDSFSLVELITFIESNASIKVGATEVNLDNLDSIERILRFVEKRTTA